MQNILIILPGVSLSFTEAITAQFENKTSILWALHPLRYVQT